MVCNTLLVSRLVSIDAQSVPYPSVFSEQANRTAGPESGLPIWYPVRPRPFSSVGSRKPGGRSGVSVFPTQ